MGNSEQVLGAGGHFGFGALLSFVLRSQRAPNTVELRLSERWLSVSPITRIGLSLRVDYLLLYKYFISFMT